MGKNTNQKTMSIEEVKKSIGEHLTAISTLVDSAKDEKLTYLSRYTGALTGFKVAILGKEKKAIKPADKPAVPESK